MSSITEPQTFLELQNDFISRMKAGGTTTDREIAKRLLNTALVNMHINPGHKFPWAERRGVIVTHASYNTGTVSITTATSRVTVIGSDTAWNTAVPGFGFNNLRTTGKIQFAGNREIYEVSSVASDTVIALRNIYVGDDLSGATYTYFEDEYALAADFLRPMDFRMFSTDMNIPLIGRTDFRRIYPSNNTFQRPKVATVIQTGFTSSTAAQYRAVFHPVPNDYYQIPYWYVTSNLAVSAAGVEQARMVEDTDEPIIPRGRRHGVTLYAVYEYFFYYKDDARAAGAMSDYTTFMGRVSGETSASDSKPRFFVQRRGGGFGSQRFDWGGRADTLGDFRRWGR